MGNDVQKNKIKALVAYTARTVALMCASGPLMQTFLSALGFDNDLIYIHSTLLQGANVLTILLFSKWVNGRNPIRRSAFALLPTGILFLAYLPLAVSKSASAESYILLCAAGVAQQISVGLFTVCEYKVPYYIYRAEEYGRMLAICGIISSLFSIAGSTAISRLATKYPFTAVMTVSFVISAALIGIAFLAIFREKSLIGEGDAEPKDSGKKYSFVGLVKHPLFNRLIHANVMRGFCTGVIGVLATVALGLGHTETLTSAMVSAGSVATLLACTVFAAFSKRFSPHAVVIVGSGMILLMPTLLAAGPFAYVVVYAVVMAGRTFVDYSVPAMLIRSVPLEIAGPYHAWRMVLQNAGALMATMSASWLPNSVLLVLAAVFQAVAGLSFYLVTKKDRH